MGNLKQQPARRTAQGANSRRPCAVRRAVPLAAASGRSVPPPLRELPKVPFFLWCNISDEITKI